MVKMAESLVLKMNGMNLFAFKELGNEELHDVDGGVTGAVAVVPLVLTASAAVVAISAVYKAAYEVGVTIGKAIYYLTH
jgi:lactobin A/cerein 7B family class IIb bacteriocin